MKSALLAGDVSDRQYRERMVYPGSFYRLVLIGTLYDVETFNTSLSFVPSGTSVPPVDAGWLTGLATTIADYWARDNTTEDGLGITSAAELTGFKLNRIGPDGRYADAEKHEHKYAGNGIIGGGSSGMPAQLSHVLTIRGADEDALAGKGRMYFPATTYCYPLGTDGRIGIAQALQAAERFSEFLDLLDGHFIDNSTGALAGIASKTRTGAFQQRLYVSSGRTIDTMRSRRTSLPEDAQHYPVIFNG